MQVGYEARQHLWKRAPELPWRQAKCERDQPGEGDGLLDKTERAQREQHPCPRPTGIAHKRKETPDTSCRATAAPPTSDPRIRTSSRSPMASSGSEIPTPKRS